MSDDQFTKLFIHMQEGFAQVRREFSSEFAIVHKRLDGVYGLLDSHIKQRETDEQERLAISCQVDRHDRWIKQLADRSSVRLDI